MKTIRLTVGILLMPFLIFAQQQLTLEKCRQMALDHNQKIKIAGENQEMATALRKATFTQFLPEFSFTGNYTHMNNKLSFFSENLFLPVVPYSAITADGDLNASRLGPNDILIDPSTHLPVLDKDGNPVFLKYAYLPKDKAKMDMTNVYMLNLGMTQPIFTGGKIVNMYKSAKIAERMARSNQVMETSDLLFKVEESYWRVISVKEKVHLAEEYQSMLKRLIYDLENLNQEGIILSNDLLKAKVKQNEVELSLLKAQNGYELSKMALCQLMGLPLLSQVELTDTVVQIPSPEGNQDLTRMALDHRAEIEMLRGGVDLSKAGVKIMQSRFLPDLGLSANYLYANPNPYNGFKAEFGSDWNVALVCHIPLFHWGERYQTLNIARHQQKINELKLNEAEELISLQTKQAFFQFNESIQKIALTSRSVRQAAENLKVTNDQFGEGMVKTSDVLEAQTLWEKAQSEKIDAEVDARIAGTNLKKVTGQLVK